MSGNILFVNACVNIGTSRTFRLSEALSDKLGGNAVRVDTESLGLMPLNGESLAVREKYAREGRFGENEFLLSHQFADADTIILASPYWGCSFNSMMKTYLEHVDTIGIVYRYAEDGSLIGMCRAKTLYYVTTRGGNIDDEHDFGYQIVKMFAAECGIENCICISASGLDIVGNDPEMILADAIRRISEKIVI